MARVLVTGVAALVLASSYAFPALAACSGGTVAGNDCGDVPSGGCCKGGTARYWCEGSTLCMEDCYFADCGWTFLDGYTCGTLMSINGDDCPTIGPCTPDCSFSECGDDGCGGSCGSCPTGEHCSLGTCVPGTGPDGCTESVDGGCQGCACETCVCDQDSYCCTDVWDITCVGLCQGCGSCATCTPDCAGKVCGDDGCGGACGQCATDQECQAGACVGGCVRDCGGKQCGDDGCGGSCGTCITGKECQDGVCATPGCTPDCTGKVCGDNGCGGVCGTCPTGKQCVDGQCSDPQVCTPSCGTRECGDDGCSGVCGVCTPPRKCSDAGMCYDPNACTPDCAGKQCGSDGCSSTCGSCADGQTCTSGQCRGGGTLADEAGGADARGEVAGTDDGPETATPPRSCPDGQVMVYGECTTRPVTGGEEGAKGGGCQAGSPSLAGPMGLLVLLVLAALRNRRAPPVPNPH